MEMLKAVRGLVFAAAVILIATSCRDSEVTTSLMSSATISAPVLTGANPFLQMNGSSNSNYIEISGQCAVYVTGFEVSFDGVFWDSVPATTTYTDSTGNTVTFTNQLNCANGTFDFRATQGTFPHLPPNQQPSFIMVRGDTAYGTTSVMTIYPPPSPQSQTVLCSDGQISVVDTTGSNLVVGGSFNQIGTCSGGGHFLQKTTMAVSSSDVFFDGTASVSLLDPNGGLFVAGNFWGINNQSVQGLAHLQENGSLQPLGVSFSYQSNSGSVVLRALALGPASNGLYPLYVGGLFDKITIGTTSTSVLNLAKLWWNPATNNMALDTTFQSPTVAALGSPVAAIQVASGTNSAGDLLVWAGGGGSANQVSLVNASTGNVAAGFAISSTVRAIAIYQDRVFIAGTSLGSNSSKDLAEYDVISSGSVVSFSENATTASMESLSFSTQVNSLKAIYALKVDSEAGVPYLYVGGNFSMGVVKPSTGIASGLIKVDLSTSIPNAANVPAIQNYLSSQSSKHFVVTALDADANGIDVAIASYDQTQTVNSYTTFYTLGSEGGATAVAGATLSEYARTLTRTANNVFVGGAFNSMNLTAARRLAVVSRSGQILGVGDSSIPSTRVTGLALSGNSIFAYSDMDSTASFFMANYAAGAAGNPAAVSLAAATAYPQLQGMIAHHIFFDGSLILLGGGSITDVGTSTALGTVVALPLSNLMNVTAYPSGTTSTNVYTGIFALNGNLYVTGAAQTTSTPVIPGVICLYCQNTSQIVSASAFGSLNIDFAKLIGENLFVAEYDSSTSATSFQIYDVSSSLAWQAVSNAMPLTYTSSSGMTGTPPPVGINSVAQYYGYTFIMGSFTSFDGVTNDAYGHFVLSPQLSAFNLNVFNGSGSSFFEDVTVTSLLWIPQYSYDNTGGLDVPNATSAMSLQQLSLPAAYFP